MFTLCLAIVLLTFLTKKGYLNPKDNKMDLCAIFMMGILSFFIFKNDILEGMESQCTIDNAWYAMMSDPKASGCKNIVPSKKNNFFKFDRNMQDGGISKWITNPKDYKSCINWLNNNQGCSFVAIDHSDNQEKTNENDNPMDHHSANWNRFSEYKKDECVHDAKGQWCENENTCYSHQNWPGDDVCNSSSLQPEVIINPAENNINKKMRVSSVPSELVPSEIPSIDQTKCNVFAYGLKAQNGRE